MKISGYVLTLNAESNIENCLKSLIGIVDELLIIDAKSTDNTINICKKYTEKIFEVEWLGFGLQRQFAVSKCKYDWIIGIDADEIISDGLRQEIIDVKKEDNVNKKNLYFLPWKTYFYGSYLKYGRFSKSQCKFFNKTYVSYNGRECHETLIINDNDSNRIYLKNPLIHYSWNDYEHLQKKLIKYSMLIAKDKKENKNPRFNNFKYNSLYIIFAFFKFFFDFIREYIFNLGFLDGAIGFIVSFNLAIYGFNKYINLYLINLKND